MLAFGDVPIHALSETAIPSSELNAGYAADGYARLRGIGALCVTYSAGALCAVNAIAGAYVEKVPVVLINGTPDIKKTLAFEQTGFSSHHFITGRETDLQSFEHLTVAQVRVDNPDLAPMLIDYALTQCITERRPVYIELLQDLVDLACEPPAGTLKPARSMSDPDSLAQSIAHISKSLEQAAKPLIWIGVEIDRLGLHEQALRLLHQLNVPYASELLSKAVLSEDDALFAGVFDGQASSDAVKQLAADSDFILALGVWLTDINTLGWDVDYEKTAFVSLDTVKHGTYFSQQRRLRRRAVARRRLRLLHRQAVLQVLRPAPVELQQAGRGLRLPGLEGRHVWRAEHRGQGRPGERGQPVHHRGRGGRQVDPRQRGMEDKLRPVGRRSVVGHGGGSGQRHPPRAPPFVRSGLRRPSPVR